MLLETWLTYVIAVLAMMCTPGPSHLLMLSNSLQHGIQRSWLTAVGDLMANALQMLAAGLGLATVIRSRPDAFVAIKWLGVGWLLWLGYNMIRNAAQSDTRHQPVSSGQLWWQGFFTSAANPKAIIFFAALFPQFIRPTEPFWTQFGALAFTYLIIDGLFLIGYGVAATRLSRQMNAMRRRKLNRFGGLVLIGAAVMLALRQVR